MGTLPNGKNYYLGGISKKRSEIILMVSSDGVQFNTWYYLANNSTYNIIKTGLYKGGAYGYNTSCFDSQYMYVIYSVEKESLEILRVPLSQIGC